jgi:nucleolin
VQAPSGFRYGFVYYDNVSSMNLAASNVNGSFWHGRRVMVTPRVKTERKASRRAPAEGPTTSIYIGNIPYETTDAELNRLFRDLDNVKDVRVAVDRVTGWPRGFAHADFHDVESAERAYKRLQGAMLGSRDLKIDYAEPAINNKK